MSGDRRNGLRVLIWEAAAFLIVLVIQGCSTHSHLISAESEKDNEEAVRLAQQKIVEAEALGCTVVSVSGGPSVALGIVVGNACVECEPIKQNQRRQVFVVNLLVKCPGESRVFAK